ncbi:hypothetical protein FHT44_002586 [Mycolicibacterium sp. BK634]|uniref:hypothetical protein n=1 Tax=Mycobacteriaceae TaxID=1762 RepID=UPI0010614E93|nr:MULTISPECIES: hypothetical protein [Mycobacteriaceae]MBB3750125.1 hypothetical protein [Mycolicibacterium sp. BK634]TDO18606.1 hypothetical protein EV580_1793 [Mycobacterium sp. BK086]
MDHADRRPLLAVAALATAGALALSPVTVTPPALHAALSPTRISSEAVQLADAWSDLFADTTANLGDLAAMTLGLNNSYPLPPLAFPLAPVATQFVLTQVAYVGLLLSGQGGQIPGWIGAHLTQLGNIAQLAVSAIPGVLLQQIKVQLEAVVKTFDYIATSGNVLYALSQAPAVFLNLALNNQFGILGPTGPIGLPLIFRNLIAAAIYTPLPTITLPFKKAAASTPNSTAAAAVTPKTPAPSGTASSARSKPKAPSSAASGKRKPATSSKSDTKGAGSGQGHSKRG